LARAPKLEVLVGSFREAYYARPALCSSSFCTLYVCASMDYGGCEVDRGTDFTLVRCSVMGVKDG